MKHALMILGLALPLFGQAETVTLPYFECTGCTKTSATISTYKSDNMPIKFCKENGQCLEIRADGTIIQPTTHRMTYKEIVEWIVAVLKEQSK